MRYETWWKIGSAPEPDLTAVDLDMSLDLYFRLVEPAIKAAFPGAEVNTRRTTAPADADVMVEIEAIWGPAGGPTEKLIDFGDGVQRIAEELWRRGNWTVPTAISLSEYPTPDRSNHRPNLAKTADDEVLDLAWNVGKLSDGRPYRVEAWAQDQITLWTFFMSTKGIEHLTNREFTEVLVREGLMGFTSGKRYVQAEKFVDESGNEMWSVNVVIGDSEETFVNEAVLPLRPYARAV